jgi:PTS system cellobiose-specific IIC component
MQSVFGLPIGVIASCGGSVSIIVMQLVLQLVLSPLLWYPWFRMADNRAYAQEQAGTEK